MSALESINLAEPNSTLEQTSLNAVGRDSVPELGLREVNIVFQLNISRVALCEKSYRGIGYYKFLGEINQQSQKGPYGPGP